MKILFVASFGGHYIQLKKIYQQIKRSASDDMEYCFAVTETGLVLDDCQFYDLPDVHRGSGFLHSFLSFKETFRVFLRVKPDVVISTGALPGLMMCFIGKILRKKVIWVDSMANYQKLSFSGGVARYFCDLCLTQWEHLSQNDKRVAYWGKIL